jgi:hypothetical protein
MAHPLPQDKKAAFIGLVVGLISIIITVFVISRLTAQSFESHGTAAPAAPAAAQPAPAPH